MSVEPIIGNFGRPSDKDIEKEFMKKIRGDKLQAINAECELDICLVLMDSDGIKRDVKRARNEKLKKENIQNEKVNENQLAMLPIGELRQEARADLFEKFKVIKNKWKFQEILDGEPLPEYFFDDGSDLSYVLHQLLEAEEDKEFSPEELLFLEFICLWERGLLNQTAKSYYEKNMGFLIKCMEKGLQKIRNELSKLHNAQQGKKAQKDYKRDSHANPTNSRFLSSEMEGEESKSESQSEGSNSQSIIRRTKPITKSRKGREKSKKQTLSPEQEAEKKPTWLAIKTCNHICWAYWYIIKK